MQIIIDGKKIDAVYGDTILETCRKADIYIPTLCYHEAFGGQGRCRLCMVELEKEGQKKMVAACTYPITEKIEVRTSTPLIKKTRRNIIMLLYKRAPNSLLLQKLFREYECQDNSLKEDPAERCILCNLCVQACQEIGSNAISLIMRGTDKRVASPYDEASEACTGCGACALICPTAAIEMVEEGNKRSIWNKTFELLACERCGKLYTTKEQWEFTAKKNNACASDRQLCESCRKKAVAEKIKAYQAAEH